MNIRSKTIYGEQAFSALNRNPACAWLSGPLPQLDTSVLLQLRDKKPARYTFKVYLGCWCEDSRALIPSFLALAKELDIPKKNIRYFALDPDKKSPKKTEVSDQVSFVPTLIVYEGDKEIGRIVETASPNLESVLLSLF